MKIRNRMLYGLLAGAIIGIVLSAVVMHLAGERNCPRALCLDSAQVVPVSDRGYFPVVHDVFRKAERSIHIAAFELKYYVNYPDSLQNTLIEDLVEAHERGVDVRIIVDEYSKENNAYDYLASKGVKIRFDPEDVTTHAKLVVVDGETVVLGSTNFSYYALEENNEADVLIVSRDFARYFEDYFEGLWGRSG